MKRILSLAVLTALTLTVVQAKNLDKEKNREIQEGIVELKTELPIKLTDESEVVDIDFNSKNGTMTTYIVLHKNFDDKKLNSQEFKEVVERETKNLKVEACGLEIAQELKEFDNFKVRYIYKENSLNGKIITQVIVTPSIDCK